MEFGLKVEDFPKDIIQFVADDLKMKDAKKVAFVKKLVDLGMPIAESQDYEELQFEKRRYLKVVKSPLGSAMRNGNVELTRTLLHLGYKMGWECAFGCDVEIIREEAVDVSKIYEHLLVAAVVGNGAIMIRELAKKGDLNMKMSDERPYSSTYRRGMPNESALWTAANLNNVGAIEALVEGGVDINTRSTITNSTVLFDGYY